MATTTTSTTDKPATTDTSTTPPAEEVPTVSAEDVKKVQEDPRFDLPSKKIKTAEDAYYAFLREEIDEKELRAVVSTFGGAPFYALKGVLERPDNAYVRAVPEDMYSDPTLAVSSVEDRLKAAQDRQDAAHEATEAAELEAAASK